MNWSTNHLMICHVLSFLELLKVGCAEMAMFHFVVFIESEWPFWDSEMSWFSDKCIVKEIDKADVYKEWADGDMKYTINDLSKHPALWLLYLTQPTYLGTSDTPSSSIWMTQEDKVPEAVFTDLIVNNEAHTLYNGSNIWHLIYSENLKNIEMEPEWTTFTDRYPKTSNFDI